MLQQAACVALHELAVRMHAAVCLHRGLGCVTPICVTSKPPALCTTGTDCCTSLEILSCYKQASCTVPHWNRPLHEP